MASEQNPWANHPSQGNPHISDNMNAQQQHQQQQDQSYQQNPSQQPHQQHQQHQGSAQSYYATSDNHSAPSSGIRRTDTEAILAQQPDRAEQVEHLQQYEASARQTEEDRNQAQLQKEFPNIDSSLIAAIYNERKSNMGEVREMLQELETTSS